MRLGAPIFETHTDPDAWIAAVQRRGYRAAYCPVKPEADAATIRAYAEAAERAGYRDRRVRGVEQSAEL